MERSAACKRTTCLRAVAVVMLLVLALSCFPTQFAQATDQRSIFNVSFDPNGGSAVQSYSIGSGLAIGVLPSSTRTGYILDGWYTAASGGMRISENTVASGDVTYYAHWKIKKGYREVNFKVNGGKALSGQSAIKVIKKNGKIGSLPKAKKATVVGAKKKYTYSFKGWYTKKSGGTKVTASTKVKKNMTLYAQWKKTTYVKTKKLVKAGWTEKVREPVYEFEINGKIFYSAGAAVAYQQQLFKQYKVVVPINHYVARYQTKSIFHDPVYRYSWKRA